MPRAISKPVVVWTADNHTITCGTSWLTVRHHQDSSPCLRLRGKEPLAQFREKLRTILASYRDKANNLIEGGSWRLLSDTEDLLILTGCRCISLDPANCDDLLTWLSTLAGISRDESDDLPQLAVSSAKDGAWLELAADDRASAQQVLLGRDKVRCLQNQLLGFAAMSVSPESSGSIVYLETGDWHWSLYCAGRVVSLQIQTGTPRRLILNRSSLVRLASEFDRALGES